jgi:hypothetical protein
MWAMEASSGQVAAVVLMTTASRIQMMIRMAVDDELVI